MEKSNFRDWTLTKINKAFGTEELETLDVLEEWLAFEHTCDAYEERTLKRIRQVLLMGIDAWNEVEVENKTISPIIGLTEIDSRKVSYFLERPLTHTVGNYELTGVVDGMIASGFRDPDAPYFCLSEFKKDEFKRELSGGTPSGQALVSMLVAQDLNADGFPVYGCYITGRHWYFIALKENKYAISKRYSADDNGIFDIFRIMLGLKHLVHQRLGIV